MVRGLNAGARELSRAELDGLIEFAQGQGAGGLVWAYVEEGERRGGRRSRSSSRDDELAAIATALEASAGDLLLLVADDAGVAAQTLGALRVELAARFGLAAEGDWKPVWITDFPLVEWNDDEGRWDPLHHPFTRPTAIARHAGGRSRRRRAPRLRHRDQRRRDRRRQHPYQPPRGAVRRCSRRSASGAPRRTRSSAS